MYKFRFQDFEIWQMAIEIANDLITISDALESRRYYRFSEQLRAASMSISNNIAEGSGSDSNKEFKYFLNVARRSVFENANILIILETRGLITKEHSNLMLEKLNYLARKISRFKESLGEYKKK